MWPQFPVSDQVRFNTENSKILEIYSYIEYSIFFWHVTFCCWAKYFGRFERSECVHLQGLRDVSELLDCNVGGAVKFGTQGTTGPARCGIPEDLSLQHRCEELRT
jgi:hypothetical protein